MESVRYDRVSEETDKLILTSKKRELREACQPMFPHKVVGAWPAVSRPYFERIPRGIVRRQGDYRGSPGLCRPDDLCDDVGEHSFAETPKILGVER